VDFSISVPIIHHRRHRDHQHNQHRHHNYDIIIIDIIIIIKIIVNKTDGSPICFVGSVIKHIGRYNIILCKRHHKGNFNTRVIIRQCVRRGLGGFVSTTTVVFYVTIYYLIYIPTYLGKVPAFHLRSIPRRRPNHIIYRQNDV